MQWWVDAQPDLLQERKLMKIMHTMTSKHADETCLSNACHQNNWQPLLTRSLVTLRQLAGSTEQDFLRIGNQMQGAYMQTTNLSQTARQLVEIASGERIATVMEQLHRLLGEMVSGLDQAQQRSIDNCGQITRVGTVLKQVTAPVEDFRRMAKQLYIFEVLIRIESTYLKEMGGEFLNIAADIKKLSTQIKGKTSAIQQNIESLSTTVSHNSRFFEQEITQGEQRKKTAIINTEASLSTLEGIHGNYLQSGEIIETIATKNSDDISEIVQSMQMHDTYRQQVEHVAEALEGLLPLLEGQATASAGEPTSPYQEVVLKIGDVCEIQQAQLQFAGSSLHDSVETIIAKLRDLHQSQREITTSMDMGAVSGNQSFLGEITTNITTVTDLLHEYGSITQTMDEMMGNVLRTMGEITTFVDDIEQFGGEIIQIALNARIKAVCTGQDGAAMSTLSDEVGQLSKDAIQRTDIISQALGEIDNITQALASGAGDGQKALTSELTDMHQRLAQLLGALEQVSRELHALTRQMQAQGQTLAKEFEQLTRGIDVHTRMQRQAAGVLDNLQQIITAARAIYPASADFKEELHNLAERYTMESERRIHEEIARKHGVTLKKNSASPKPAVSHQPSSEFGDNVDLF
jgi:methyl-accepting chemotaxis protein